MDMAPKKKNDVDEEKERLAKDAKAVGKAADRALGHRSLQEDLFRADDAKVPMGDTHFGSTWDQTRIEVDELDKGFKEEGIVNRLRRQFSNGDVDVRVLSIGPDGRLTDVSDKVNPRDIRPEQVSELRENGVPLSKNPRTAEAAMEALQRMLPGLRTRDTIKSGPGNSTAESIRRMEIVLAESDKILEHWKK
jgi:hypothetical protein